MGIPDTTRDQLSVRFGVLFPHLDERQRRPLMGAEARVLGHGGVRVVVQAAQVSETTVRKGMDELEAGEGPLGRVRRPGGGRKRPPRRTRGCGRPCSHRSSRTYAGIRYRRCAGRPSRRESSPPNSPARGTR